MSRILYLDCFSGASGDMIAGALVDAGVPLDVLARAVDSLALDGVEVGAERVDRSGIGALKFRVTVRGEAADAPGAASHDRPRDRAHGTTMRTGTTVRTTTTMRTTTATVSSVPIRTVTGARGMNMAMRMGMTMAIMTTAA